MPPSHTIKTSVENTPTPKELPSLGATLIKVMLIMGPLVVAYSYTAKWLAEQIMT